MDKNTIWGGTAPFPSFTKGFGLKKASEGLKKLFSTGSISDLPIVEIRNILLKNGFTQSISENGSGYLFKNGIGEEVRIMSRNASWEIRVKTQYGSYLNEYGNIPIDRAGSHGIKVRSY